MSKHLPKVIFLKYRSETLNYKVDLPFLTLLSFISVEGGRWGSVLIHRFFTGKKEG